MSLHKEREIGQAAEQVLTNPVYQEAWAAYRLRILEEIEAADSKNIDLVVHLKRLLSAASAARGHMERLVKEGAFAAKQLEFEEKRGIRRIFG